MDTVSDLLDDRKNRLGFPIRPAARLPMGQSISLDYNCSIIDDECIATPLLVLVGPHKSSAVALRLDGQSCRPLQSK